MSCKKNGKTFVSELVPVPAAEASTTTGYLLVLEHFFCGGRKMCINSGYPVSSNLSYRVLNVELLSTGVYSATIAVTGTITYLPYRRSCENSCPCPVTEPVFTEFAVPVTTATTPTISGGGVIVSAANVKECCSLCDAVQIETSITVTPGA